MHVMKIESSTAVSPSRPTEPSAQEEVQLQSPPTTNTNTPWAHLIAGAAGGLATAVATSPLDVLRTRLQTNFYQVQLSSLQLRASPDNHLRRLTRHFHETLQILSFIRGNEGWRGFFRGLGPSLTGVVPATAVKFYAYGNCKSLLVHHTELAPDAISVQILAAAAAGIVTATVTNPIWLVKTRLQLDKSHAETTDSIAKRRYKNSLDCLIKVLQQEGVRGLYRGLSASYLGAIETTVHLTFYEQIRSLLSKTDRIGRHKDGSRGWIPESLLASIAGGSSKIISSFVAYPHEVIRTRMRQAPVDGGLQYTGIVRSFSIILREEGFAALYSGLTAHILRSVPSAAITLGIYSYTLNRLS